MLAVADLAIASHAEKAREGGVGVGAAAGRGGGGGSYMLKATRWVLAQEAALLAGMREAAVERIALLGDNMDRS